MFSIFLKEIGVDENESGVKLRVSERWPDGQLPGARQENRQERRLNRIKNQDGRKKFHSFMKPIMKGVSTVGQKAIEGGTNVALLGIKRAEQEASQQLM